VLDPELPSENHSFRKHEALESTKFSSIKEHGTKLLDIKQCHTLKPHSCKCNTGLNLYHRCQVLTYISNTRHFFIGNEIHTVTSLLCTVTLGNKYCTGPLFHLCFLWNLLRIDVYGLKAFYQWHIQLTLSHH